ncbi:MAG: hypothetical protein IKW39_01395 [Alphaproteobacteria bacterium]|nr:hypothetical protein [Alphaproteobacteria bacterium]
MYKFFCYLLLFLYSFVSVANDNIVEVKNNEDGVEVFVKKIEKNIIKLPTCNDEKLIEETKEFITSFYNKHIADNMLDKRRKHFVLKNIHLFEEENISNYKTEAKRPVSDVIANLLINENILEENMKLCKNQSPNNEASQVYILIYPSKEKGFNVNVLNLLNNKKKVEDAIFAYTP